MFSENLGNNIYFRKPRDFDVINPKYILYIIIGIAI